MMSFFDFSWTDIAPKWEYHGINWDISRIFESEKWHHIRGYYGTFWWLGGSCWGLWNYGCIPCEMEANELQIELSNFQPHDRQKLGYDIPRIDQQKNLVQDENPCNMGDFVRIVGLRWHCKGPIGRAGNHLKMIISIEDDHANWGILISYDWNIVGIVRSCQTGVGSKLLATILI